MSDLLRIAFPKFERFAQIERWFMNAGLPISDIQRPGLHHAGDPWDCGMNIECFSVSHADVGTYVERGVAALGIMESDKLFQSKFKVWSPYTLPFGRYPVVLAAPRGQNMNRLISRPILRLATPLTDFVDEWFTERGMSVEIVHVSDRPDTAVLLGMADAFVGVLDENHDIDKNGFCVIDVLTYTELKLIVNNAIGEKRRHAIQKIIHVLQNMPVLPSPRVDIPCDEEDLL